MTLFGIVLPPPSATLMRRRMLAQRQVPPTLTESEKCLFYAIPPRFRRDARWWFRR